MCVHIVEPWRAEEARWYRELMTEVLEMTLIRQIEAVPGEDSPLVPTKSRNFNTQQMEMG